MAKSNNPPCYEDGKEVLLGDTVSYDGVVTGIYSPSSVAVNCDDAFWPPNLRFVKRKDEPEVEAVYLTAEEKEIIRYWYAIVDDEGYADTEDMLLVSKFV